MLFFLTLFFFLDFNLRFYKITNKKAFRKKFKKSIQDDRYGLKRAHFVSHLFFDHIFTSTVFCCSSVCPIFVVCVVQTMMMTTKLTTNETTSDCVFVLEYDSSYVIVIVIFVLNVTTWTTTKMMAIQCVSFDQFFIYIYILKFKGFI